jgi:signal transduction histidine kinase
VTGFWSRLGRTDAINVVTFVTVAYLQLLGTFVVGSDNVDGNELLFATASLASFLPVAVVFLIGRYLLLPKIPPGLRPWATLIVFEVAGLVRAVAFDQAIVFSGLGGSELWLRISGSQGSWLIGGVIVSNLVVLAREFSERNERLYESTLALAQIREELVDRLAQRKDQLIASITAELGAGLKRLGGRNPRQDARTLTSLIDDVVRPISHQLGREFTSSAPHLAPSPVGPIQWNKVLRHALATNPVHPLWATAWLSLGGLNLFVSIAGSAFFGPFAVTLATFFLSYLGLWWVWTRLPAALGTAARASIFSLFSLGLPFLVNYLVEEFFGLPMLVPRLLIAEALYFWGTSWALAMVLTARELLQSTNALLNSTQEELNRLVAQENAAARRIDEGVSRVLHGPIQDAIALALRRLQQRPPDYAPSREDLSDIREPITTALRLLENPEDPPDELEETLNNLVALWAGEVHINVTVEPEAQQALTSDAEAQATVAEIIREAVSNAIRHGDATAIDIDVGCDVAARDVAITVTNNGKPVDPQAEHGVGTRFLQDFSHHWSRTNTETTVVVKATVPLARR